MEVVGVGRDLHGGFGVEIKGQGDVFVPHDINKDGEIGSLHLSDDFSEASGEIVGYFNDRGTRNGDSLSIAFDLFKDIFRDTSKLGLKIQNSCEIWEVGFEDGQHRSVI